MTTITRKVALMVSGEAECPICDCCPSIIRSVCGKQYHVQKEDVQKHKPKAGELLVLYYKGRALVISEKVDLWGIDDE